MCLFPLPNTNFNGLVYKKGVREFSCGACPECLNKRSSQWALKSVFESESHAYNCMITLTYDTFARDNKGNFILDKNGNKIENPVDPDLSVSKRDIQLFVKRLRKWYSSVSDEKIKYLACAEYGSRTHRAHYHLILFGVKFPDLVYYKKSKRKNCIYMSQTLTKLWNHGICTVDSVSVRASVARYCTKYCAKSRSDNTFMLCSHNIGLEELYKKFNGRSYWIDGREYPVPKSVWQKYITDKYSSEYNFTYKYLNPIFDDDRNILNIGEFENNCLLRSVYRSIRDSDVVYSDYLKYWQWKGSCFEQNKLSPEKRIYLLSSCKYKSYKTAALKCIHERKIRPYTAPGSKCISQHAKWLHERYIDICPIPSCPNRANDTKFKLFGVNKNIYLIPLPNKVVQSVQISLFDPDYF
ncbi:replication initiator protein [Sigmofec virus UA08Rod_5550]|uniref:Replication initiator protein n=1 Tax=Sigmofec virus UA08Rod_5550 TaxID=2929429 RepID=A0A976N0S6_9VIRU|nr:replication initiator protein [Sigmofec virus UA08Rod_5550]